MIKNYLGLFCCLILFFSSKTFGFGVNDTVIVIFAENGKSQIKLMPRYVGDSCFRNKPFFRAAGYSYQVNLYDSNDKEKKPVLYDLYFTPVNSQKYKFIGWKKREIKKIAKRMKRSVAKKKIARCEKLVAENLSIIESSTRHSQLPQGQQLIKIGDLNTRGNIERFINFSNSGIVIMLADQFSEGKYFMLQVNLVVSSPIKSEQLRY